MEKVSPKGPLLKSPTPVKLSPRLSPSKNGADLSKTNGAVKKMDASPPKVSVKSMTSPSKTAKGSPTKPTLERNNSHGDGANIQPVKSEVSVDNGVVHANGNCDVVCPIESRLKENHFGLDFSTSASEKENVEKNGHCELPSIKSITETSVDETLKGDSPLVKENSSVTAQDHASGDKAPTKDTPELKASATEVAAAAEAESKGVPEENQAVINATESKVNDDDGGDVVKSEVASDKSAARVNNESPSKLDEECPLVEAAKCSPSSNATDCTECSAETAKLVEPEITKQSLREKVWDHLDKHDLVVFPRPCKGRIPNFKGAPTAAEKLTTLDVFKNSKTIKVNPDKPQEMVRFHTLEYGKRLLVPVPRLREGLFQAVVPPTDASKYRLQQASQRYGMKKWSKPISLDDKVSIDLVVLGSVVVDRKGRRIGKGESFADLEFAMLVKMNAVNENTVIVTTVHDDQVYDELPEDLFREHDVPVDWIITPTQVIEVADKLPRPNTIIWNILSNRRILEIPILQKLREEELSEGQECALKEVDSDVEEKPYVQRFTRRRRFNYSQSTGDPMRDNRMFAPQGHYYNRPRRFYQPPSSNRPNNYGPAMRGNAPPARRSYYQEPYEGKQQPMGRPMREPRTQMMNHSDRVPMNRPQSMARPRSQNRSRSDNRSRSMNRVNGGGPRNRSDARSGNRQSVNNSLPIKSMTKSVEVQTVDKKSRIGRQYLKRKRAPVDFSLLVKNIGVGVRVRDLKVALNERGIKPRDITWRGYKGSAFLHFVKQAGTKTNHPLNVDEVIKTLQDLPLPPMDKKSLVIEPLQSKNSEPSATEKASAVTQVEDDVVLIPTVVDASSVKTKDKGIIVPTESSNVVKEKKEVLVLPTMVVDA